MFKVRKLLLLIAGFLFTSLALADNVTAEDLWSQSTANTREGAADLNNQIMAQQAQQQLQQGEQQQQMQQALETIQMQQKAMLNNQTAPTTTSTFQAQPSTVTGTTNPWVKPNPWQNTEQNPYAGQKYTPTTPSTNLNSAAGASSSANSSTSNTTNTIYVNPNIQPSQQKQQQPNSNPINIYK